MTIDHKFKAKLAEENGPLTFALFLRVSRTSMDLTQAEFGKKLKLSRANICDIEKGRHLVSTDLAIRIARQSGLPEKMALQACLQDQVRKIGFDAKVLVS
jgi:DNA-binding XRE family transcriptional regulator